MTFDLENAREVAAFMQSHCHYGGERFAEAINEIERLQKFRDRIARILKQPLTDCDDLLILGLGARICQLRRQAAEIERLRASLIDLHAEYINTLEKNPECSAWDLDEQSDADQKRLRRNAAHAISIVEPPIYLQAEQRATKIKELEDALVDCQYAPQPNGCDDWGNPIILSVSGGAYTGTTRSWQITEERKAAFVWILRRLEYDQSLPGHTYYKIQQAMELLRGMLKEAEQ